ncbi:Mov34/MPN/PAD-1 family protein [Planctomyces sp. SH-PL14]|uniref:Mov34/MPN/PAD-1 family protein n=1 Tax=Planctomyces sp. SH-PL14 TaxID=1632864 RepID=UPI00078CA19D|nr:Mov34/MPN/PAD-1 family protein [Planctomyces sp. SH-PL14]AMV19633.1 ThiF family protein [Planctomyces sp. SH-PL14]
MNYLEPSGIIADRAALQIPRAIALAAAVADYGLPYVEFVECRQHVDGDDLAETVVFDVEVERPQQTANDIRKKERISVTFLPSDNWYPEVLALRDNFPRVSHTNVREKEFPRSLCLYDQPWEQIAIRWTAASVVERIRFWLAETAKGTLHQDDQPLEPMLLGNGYRIVLPFDFFDGESNETFEELKVSFATNEKDCRLLRAEKGQGAGGLPFLALSFVAEAQMHGAIRHAPKNLKELDEFLKPAGVPIVELLYKKLEDWNKKELLDKKILLVVAFPLTRNGEETIESSDLWVFLTTRSVGDVGVAIGLWDKLAEHSYGRPILRDPKSDGQAIGLSILSPLFHLSAETAAISSGLTSDLRPSIAIGAGALGSQVLRLLAQSGFGAWCVVDKDVLLPHNVARHALDNRWIGFPKALPVAIELRSFYDRDGDLKWIDADLLRPDDKKQQLDKELAEAELVLDLAASIPVSRHLTYDVQSNGRRIAAFLNPRGTDLVLLVEDTARTIGLDFLEMQYYRAICQTAELENHLSPPDGRLRYARSCRDVSSTIPNYAVAMHAAIAAKAIRDAVQGANAEIRIWTSDPESLEVRHLRVAVSSSKRSRLGEWTLVVDDQLTARIAKLRLAKLPHETGGVLIGSYDLARKIVYVVDTIPSPPDSEEWPTLYIRGMKGLKFQVDKVQEMTGGQIEYVGEWHSHPAGCPCLPSDDDLKVFSWLTENMDVAGLPALMGIAGDHGYTEWYLGQMLRSGGWRAGT